MAPGYGPVPPTSCPLRTGPGGGEGSERGILDSSPHAANASRAATAAARRSSIRSPYRVRGGAARPGARGSSVQSARWPITLRPASSGDRRLLFEPRDRLPIVPQLKQDLFGVLAELRGACTRGP